MTRSSIETAKVTPAALIDLQVDRREKPRLPPVPRVRIGVCHQRRERSDIFARAGFGQPGGVSMGRKRTHGGARRGDVDDTLGADRHHAGADAGPPCTPRDRARKAVFGKDVWYVAHDIAGHVISGWFAKMLLISSQAAMPSFSVVNSTLPVESRACRQATIIRSRLRDSAGTLKVAAAPEMQ